MKPLATGVLSLALLAACNEPQLPADIQPEELQGTGQAIRQLAEAENTSNLAPSAPPLGPEQPSGSASQSNAYREYVKSLMDPNAPSLPAPSEEIAAPAPAENEKDPCATYPELERQHRIARTHLAAMVDGENSQGPFEAFAVQANGDIAANLGMGVDRWFGRAEYTNITDNYQTKFFREALTEAARAELRAEVRECLADLGWRDGGGPYYKGKTRVSIARIGATRGIWLIYTDR